jgi:hypothetical protein
VGPLENQALTRFFRVGAFLFAHVLIHILNKKRFLVKLVASRHQDMTIRGNQSLRFEYPVETPDGLSFLGPFNPQIGCWMLVCPNVRICVDNFN